MVLAVFTDLVSSLQYFLGFVIFTVIVYLIVSEWTRYAARIKGLPGPLGLPIIGNLHQIHGKQPAEQYRLWAAQYGPVFQVQLGNTPVVVINSAAAAKALLLSQGSATMSRPVLAFFHQNASSSALSIGMSPWDESCKRKRKAAATTLNRSKTPSYHPILIKESTELMEDLLETGSAGKLAFSPEAAVHRFALNLSLMLNYGTRSTSTKNFSDASLFQEAIDVEREIGRLRSVGLNYGNYIPAVRYLQTLSKKLKLKPNPQSHGKDIGQRRTEYNQKFLDELRIRVAAGTDNPCIQGGVLRDPESSSLTETELLGISFSMMAGSETNTPTIGWAMLLLAKRPDLQQTAFNAIAESGSLAENPLGLEGEVPYIMAFTKEVLRYFAPLRLALPKATSGDAEWQGSNIPKNTMVFLNAWSCNREESSFADPFTFSPERWLIENPHAHYGFGYGGRMCIAAHVATKALYTVFLHLIGNFKISPGVGNKDDIDIDPMSGIDNIAHTRASPRWKKLRFLPRNEEKLRQALRI